MKTINFLKKINSIWCHPSPQQAAGHCGMASWYRKRSYK